jgi:hypothetical protein
MGAWQPTCDATVGGGEFALQLTQIQAGIKFVNPHTINPLTGGL